MTSDRTPLAEYLDRKDMTQADFGRLLESELGYVPARQQVTAWVHGYYAPRPQVQLAMESATRGGVKARDWTRWAARRKP